MDEKVLVCAVGDVGPRRNDPDYPFKDPIFALSAPITRSADIAFCQLERILSARPDRQYYGNVVHPDNVKQLTDAGFNVVSFASNHHMDAGVEAFVDTLDVLKKHHIRPVGVGMNISEARAGAIVERKGVRVAFLGYSSIIPKAEIPYDAEPGRPGCAPMFVSTFYEASDWQPATPFPRVISMADKDDLAAMKEDIARAKAKADIVVMSIHWGVHHVPGLIAMYQFEVGHAAVDAGVDMVLGHHAHILKGIEVYKGKPIFYSLANFAMDSAINTRKANSDRWDCIFKPEVDPEDQGSYRYPDLYRKTIMVKCTLSNKKIERVSFLPFMINQLGQPEPLSGEDKRSKEIFEYVKWACHDQKLATRFRQDGNEIVVCTEGE
ncbi:MAG: CapA family protein [Chloroflexi bacterium]|nr:CapA family protein [Chloroflexota bacterium]